MKEQQKEETRTLSPEYKQLFTTMDKLSTLLKTKIEEKRRSKQEEYTKQ